MSIMTIIYFCRETRHTQQQLILQSENKALRRSKQLVLETVREGYALNGSLEME